MSAGGSSRTASSGATGMPLPHRNGRARGETMRTRNGALATPDRISVGQRLPAADSTSTMPYSAEPAVSGTATTSVSREDFRRVARTRVRLAQKNRLRQESRLCAPRVNA